MLGKPFAGWSTITVNNEKLGRASYLDWIPELVIEPCIRYIERASKDIERWGYSPGGYGFNIEFDGEDKGKFGIVEIGNDFYTYDTLGNELPYIRLKEIDLNPFKWKGYKFVRFLLSETVKDIEADFEGWVLWDAFDEEDAEQSRKALKILLEEAKDCLQSEMI